jgi:hypothetical protein
VKLKPTWSYGMGERTGRACARQCVFVSDVKLVKRDLPTIPEEDLWNPND